MEIRQVDETFAVAPQFQPEDMPQIAKRGFVAIICNRPDGEEPGQPDAATMRKAAEDAGLAFHHLPITGGQFTEPSIAAFRAVRWGTEGPILAYCRTGTRSISLEMLANPRTLSAAERLQRAQAAGYDLTGLQDRLGE